MEMGDGPSNSITTIENFIDSHFQGNEEYYSNAVLTTGPFVFPPGHTIRTAHFEAEVRSMSTLVSSNTPFHLVHTKIRSHEKDLI